MNRKKVVSLLMATIVIGGTLAGCAGTTAAPAASATPAASAESSSESTSEAAPASSGGEKSIVIQTYTDNGNIDPYNMNTNAYPITNNVYEPLWWDAPDWKEMVLATEIEETDDALHYIIHLRENVTFSNGNPFTASDAIFSLATYAASPNGGQIAGLVDLEKTAAIDDLTVDLYMQSFSAFWKQLISSVLIIDEESYDAEAIKTQPIGTGAYILDSYTVGVGAELSANPTYWGGQPDITRFTVKEMDEDTQVTTALETGELDVAYLAPTADLWYLDDMDKFNTYIESISKSNLTLFDQTEGSPFTSVDARLAVCYAIDNQSIINLAYEGLGEEPKSLFSTADPVYKDYHNDYTDIYKSSVSEIEKAQELVKKAGLEGAEITVAVQSTPTYKTEGELIQQNLEAAGFGKVNILAIDNSSFYTALGDSELWDIAVTGMTCADGTGLHTFQNLHTSIMAYLTFPDEDAFMARIDDAFATENDDERQEKIDQLTKEIIENGYMYNNMDMGYGYVYNTDIEGFKICAGRQIWVKDWTLNR